MSHGRLIHAGGWGRRGRLLAAGLAGVVAAVLISAPSGGQAPPAEGAQAQAAGPVIRTVEDLLAHMEHVDRGLETLTAGIQYDKRFRLQGGQHVRRGTLHFSTSAPAGEANRPRRSFAIHFVDFFVDGRLEEDPEHWVFNGEWLVERRPEQKQFIKRRIAPPNAEFDPLRIGEGPMPIPIGQKPADILRRYIASLEDSEGFFKEGAPLERIARECHQLRLVPRPERAEEDDFVEIRLWYRWDEKAQRLLPRMARTVNRSGDEAYVQLIDVKVNEPIDRAAFDVAPPPEGQGWDIQIIDDMKKDGAEGEE